MFAPSCLSTEKYPSDIIVKDKDHQHQQHKETYMLGCFTHLCAYRMPDGSLNKKEHQMPAVQDRYREEIEDAQVNTEERYKKYKIAYSFPGLLSRHFGDHDRAADGICGNRALYYFHNAENREFCNLIGLDEALRKCLKRIQVFGKDFS